MKHKNKFISDFFLVNTNDKRFSRHIGEWSVIDLDKTNDKKIEAHFGKKLKDVLFYSEKIKRPLFIKIDTPGSGYSLPVTLFNPKTMQSITTLAVVDSGATSSVFHHELVEAIGINYKKEGKQLKAFVVGKFVALSVYRMKILMSISNSRYIYEEKIDIINESSDNLLGLSGFFNHYEVVFNPKFGIKYKFIN
jgi:hypothetical protein